MANFPLSIERLTGATKVKAAAVHNLREPASPYTDRSHINAQLSQMNVVVEGPSISKEVCALSGALLAAAGIKRLKSNSVRALEIVFTWPFDTQVHPQGYFDDCVAWAKSYFDVPVLSTVIHLDESEPHCHMLLLPLVNGRMNGSRLHGGTPQLRAMQNSFHKSVSSRYGINRPEPLPRLSAAVRAKLMGNLEAALYSAYGMSKEAMNIMLRPHRANPLPMARFFGLAPALVRAPSDSEFVKTMTRSVAPKS